MTIDLISFHVAQPMAGSRFVSFYGDGSGASLFLRDDAGDYYTAEGDLIPDKHWFMDSGHCLYAYLPNNFRLFFEESTTYPLEKQP